MTGGQKRHPLSRDATGQGSAAWEMAGRGASPRGHDTCAFVICVWSRVRRYRARRLRARSQQREAASDTPTGSCHEPAPIAADAE